MGLFGRHRKEDTEYRKSGSASTAAAAPSEGAAGQKMAAKGGKAGSGCGAWIGAERGEGKGIRRERSGWEEPGRGYSGIVKGTSAGQEGGQRVF